MKCLMFIVLSLLSSVSWATGGFEKSTLWSARAAYHGGAYASSVKGSEALVFNPAELSSDHGNEISFGLGAASGDLSGPIVKSGEKVKAFSGPVIPLGVTYAKNLSEKDALGVGVYAVGGLSTGFKDIDLKSRGSEFSSFRPDAYGRLSIIELGLGYSRKLNSNFSVGGTIRNHYAEGGFSQVQVTEAQGLGGSGIPDGTVLAISNGEFETLKGHSLGAFTLGASYQPDDSSLGASVVYRSRVDYSLEGKSQGKIAYSNTGAAVTGATAGEVYELAGRNSTVESSLPEAWTVSLFRKIGEKNTAHFEYTFVEYSKNERLSIDSSLRNSVDGSTSDVPDVPLKWKDLHEFKLGWTNTALENWIIGGGYSLSLPVTNKSAAGATFAPPGNFHNFFLGAGYQFSRFRIDAAYENYFSSGDGKTAGSSSGNQASPPIEGEFSSWCYSFIGSFTYFL